MGSLQIDVFNPPFVIQVNESDEYLQKLLGYYKKIINRIQQNGALKNPLQVSSLAGIILCDELYKEKSKAQLSRSSDFSDSLNSENENLELERITKNMIEKIEKALS